MMNNELIEKAYFIKGFKNSAAHTHNTCQIMYLKKGKVKLTVSSKEYLATSPCLIFINNLEQHSIEVLDLEYDRYNLYIYQDVAGRLINNRALLTILSNRPENFNHVLNIKEIEPEIEDIFNRIIAETNQNESFSFDCKIILVKMLLLSIYRFAPEFFPSSGDSMASVVWQIQREFEQNYMKQFALGQLAQKHHISVYHLSHRFKEITGYGVMKYLALYRLSVARNLLCSTSMPITDVVTATGFSDNSNFSRYFKREYGCTPSEYRRHMKN